MHYPRLLLTTATLGLLASVLPAFAAAGDIASIGLRDFNRNGKIDRALVTFSNPSGSTWTVRGTSGLEVAYNGAQISLDSAFMASSGNPAVLEVVFDENDVDLPVSTSADGFEITYRRSGVSTGVSDGVSELATIALGDTGVSDTELDQAPPILISSTPVPGATDVVRTDDLTLVFSEPVNRSSLLPISSLNPGGWFYTSIGEGRTITVQHDAYAASAQESFGISANDLAGNALVTDAYPNPFTFTMSPDSTPNPGLDSVFVMTAPASLSTLTIGEANILAWYHNISSVASVRLSYSTDGGQTWTAIATVPAPQNTYVWYAPQLTGALQLKAEGRDVNNAFVGVSVVTSLSLTGTAAANPLRVVSPIETSLPTATTASFTVRLDRTPSTASFSCNNSTLSAPVQVTGDRPARLVAALANLVDGASYACSFRVTDAAGAAMDLPAAAFTAGIDLVAPELIGPATIDQFDAAAGTARLTWTTNEPSTAAISYGVYLNYGSQAADANLATTHSVTLSGLRPGEMHQARITSIDAKGNPGVSKDFYFVFLREGDLIKGKGPAVYWYKGGKRSAFPHLDTYRSWFGDDFSKVIRVPDTQLGTILLGANVKMKDGVYLVKIQSDPKTYAVTSGGILRWIQTEEQARALYGAAWASRVRDVDVSLFTDYAIGDPL